MDKLELIKKQCGKYEFIDYPAMFGYMADMARSEYENARKRQSEVDMELSDLLHYLEKDGLSAPKIAKVSSEIRKRRIERRQVSANVFYLDKLVKVLDGGKCKYALQELQADYICRYNDADYVPRVLDIDKDFFGGGK